MNRKRLVAGNWKMNKTPAEAVAFASGIAKNLDTNKADVVFCVPSISLTEVLRAVSGTDIKIGAQNMYFEESGAFTGEISPEMLTSAGITHVIIGHSERREYFGETDDDVHRKTVKALEHGLTPIVCVGETLTQREQGITIDLVRLQTKIALNGLSACDAKKCVVAYEPIWAIGTGKTATSEQAEEVCMAIRSCIADIFNKDT
ncbi:MAG: triose-phosphate isomerase, partial [Clostridiales bacterium]|nr:triose-phosphate isomerase [Clostridiales bacterium]